MAKLLSDRVKKTSPLDVPADRYQFIKLSDVEPDLGAPLTSLAFLSSDNQGVRSWYDLGAGLALDGTNIIVDEDTVFVDTTGFNNSTANNLQQVLTDLDSAVSNPTITIVSDDTLVGAGTAGDPLGVNPDLSITSITVDSADINGNTTVDGTLDVTGNTTVVGTLGVTGDTTVDGTVGITGNTTVVGTLGVTGDTSVEGTLQVTSSIDMVSPDSTNTISIDMLDNDSLSFSGESGELFSIIDALTGTIFSVNDISGVPSIEVDDDGTVRFAEIDGNVLIGTTIDDATHKLQISGNVSINSHLILDTETTTLATTAQTQISSFPVATYSSGKFVIQAKISGEVHTSELIVVHDGTTASVTEYGVIYTGSAPLANYDVDISAGNVRILAEGASATSTVYKITKHLISV